MRGPGERRIENYGLIGDCETAALVGRDGTIDWLCWPRFDSSACLAALVGDEENGCWRLAPATPGRITRRYRGDTLILETTHETDEGRVLVTDMMPLRGEASDIVRIVAGRGGQVRMASTLDLRFATGRLRPLIRRLDETVVAAIAGPDAVVLRADRPLDMDESLIRCDFEIGEGERVTFAATYFPSYRRLPRPIDPAAVDAETERFWTDWIGQCTYEGPYGAAVRRSLVTLKALTYRPTGGIVAAPTTSLPEQPGGARNWDYRYCWLRDAAFTLLALVHAGYSREAAAWRDWLLRAVAGEPGSVRPLYGLAGDQGIIEQEADWLAGFNGARPVRLGNAAHDQLQLDVFGEVIDAFHLARQLGLKDQNEAWELQRHMLANLARRWHEPDAGIWESRAAPRHFVHSKVLAWAAFDRGIASVRGRDGEDHVGDWRRIRAAIHDEVFARGFDRDLNSFVRAYGSKALDASTLLFPLIGFVEPDDPRALGTVAAIERGLMQGGFVQRYNPEHAADGVHGGEGMFLACSCWLADNYALQGRGEDAHKMFERVAGVANDLGLIAEEYDPCSGRLRGNFPQGFSHFALVSTAFNLSRADGPAQMRRQLKDES
jgi:GH15 family glucan-1,4-alpha-glucosidase